MTPAFYFAVFYIGLQWTTTVGPIPNAKTCQIERHALIAAINKGTEPRPDQITPCFQFGTMEGR